MVPDTGSEPVASSHTDLFFRCQVFAPFQRDEPVVDNSSSDNSSSDALTPDCQASSSQRGIDLTLKIRKGPSASLTA